MATLGTYNVLSIVRESTPGLYLDGEELGEILLPKRYIPRDVQPKQKLEVFVYRDSEDRLVATTEQPLATVGEFACLKVIGMNDRAGAFLDWGLAKDLLLPFREQVRPVRVGERVVVFILVDPRSERIIATTRLKRHFSREAPLYRPNAPVNLLITGSTSVGYEAIVDDRYGGCSAIMSPRRCKSGNG
jgi:predicted RNA-binding protein (virulence factor B family)